MFEDKTFESLVRRKIAWTQDFARQQGFTLDTRTASMIYFALAGNSVEMEQAYVELEQALDESFADTQSRDFLIRRAGERGVVPYPSTAAVRKGEFNIDVPFGSRFSLGHLNYSVIERITFGTFKLECETPGNVGNLESGILIPKDYIQGLETATLTDVLIPGGDEELTEHLRKRYFSSLSAQAFGGNIQDYVEKTMKLGGVGGVKVYPAWNGGGTVKIVFSNSQYQKPSDVLADAVQTAIDPVQNQGMGLGVVPIGHVVTVEGVENMVIDIGMQLAFEAGWGWDEVEPFVTTAIDEYFGALAAEWDNVNWREDADATLVARINQIQTRILAVVGILDITNFTFDGSNQNIALPVNSIPVRGSVVNG